MFKTAAEAERGFYEAFAQQNVEGMMQVWADHRPVYCIHPGGALLVGREEIEDSWRRIFQAEAPFHFELEYHFQQEYAHQMAISQVTETLYLQQHIVGVVLATNSFCVTEEGWRMILHHASPQPVAESSSSPVFH